MRGEIGYPRSLKGRSARGGSFRLCASAHRPALRILIMASWPVRTDSKLPDSAVRDLGLLIDNLANVPRLVESAKKQTPELRPDRLYDNIQKDTGIELTIAKRIFNTLENLVAFKDDLGGPDKAIARVMKSLPEETKKKYEENIDKLISLFEIYDKNNPIAISYKAQRLTYLRNKLIHDSEIISDARPIFNEAGDNIVEFVVTHELILTLLVDGSFKREHLTLDHADILALRKACDRALIKSGTIKKTLEGKLKVEVLRDDA